MAFLSGDEMLSPRRRKFASEYVKNGFNGVQAVFAAGYKQGYDSACTEAWRLLRNAEVKRHVEEHLQASKISADEVLEELSKLARAKISDDKITESGKLKALELSGKAHKLFTDKVETTDTTKSPAQALVEMVAAQNLPPITLEQAEKIMAASIQRASSKLKSA